jgi:small subunit ribosomal protein S4
MGDPRKHRKKYETPVHPWQKTRIVEEIKLLKEYGLKNKKEIWKFTSFLKKYKDQAKKLIAMQGSQADLERQQMMDKLKSYGLIKPGNETFDAIFSLQIKDVLDRMLQVIVCKKMLARSPKQARQFITHCHILVGDRKITSPRYLVPIKEEPLVNFTTSSSIYSVDHPERPKPDEKKKSEMVIEAKKATKKVDVPKTNIKEVKKTEEKTKEKKVDIPKEVKKVESKPTVEKKEVPKKEEKKVETPKEEKSSEVKKDAPKIVEKPKEDKPKEESTKKV